MKHLSPVSIFIAVCIICFPAAAQTEYADTLPGRLNGSPEILPVEPSAIAVPDAQAPGITEPVTLSPHLDPPSVQNVNAGGIYFPRVSYIPGTAVIRQWNGGTLFATASRDSLAGLMATESGSLDLVQRLGPVTVSLYGAAAKYGYFRGLSTSYGFGGSATWQIAPNLSITAFGSYWTPAGVYGPPAMMANVAVTNIGGYLDWRFHPHWGVKAGVQSYRSMVYGGRWETQPIVMPYYRTSSGVELGVDLGGILYQLVRSLSSDSNWGRSGNPTIEPPKGSMFSNSMDF